MSAPNLFLFGAPRLERDGVPIEVDTRKAIALIAYLAVTRQSHSRDALATLLWEDYDQSRARAALRRTLSVLHTALGAGQLEIEREAIGLNPNASLRVDVDQFRTRLAECQTHGHPPLEVCSVCVTPLAEAAALYRDDFLAGFTLRDSPNFDEWQFFQTESLRRDLASALEKLVLYHSTQKEVERAIIYARRWLGLDPLHEPVHRHLMQLYVLAGERAAALRQYQECVRVLQQELGVPPLEETMRLYEAIKENRGQVASAPWSVSSEKDAPAIHPPLITSYYPLVGRDEELATLLKTYDNIGANEHFILLEGEAGVGKTRLAEAFLERIQGKGAIAISARCYEGETNLTYGPFIEVLRAATDPPDRAKWLRQVPAHVLGEVSRLLPELRTLRQDLPPLPPLDSPGAPTRFFDGISHALLAICGGHAPGIFFIDDLQWADPASLDLLTYLVQRLRGRRMCILAAWRGELPALSHPLRQLLANSKRAGFATVLPVSRLNASAVAELVETIPGAPREIAERLYRESEGLPFFIVEYLAAIERENRSGDERWSLPGSVREMLHSRLSGVSETGVQLLNTGAVIGRSFDFETLRDASGRSEEETATALEALITQGLVKEVRSGSGDQGLTYDFGHDKLRALVYEETSRTRRRLMHRRVAEAMATRARLRHQTGALANQIAYHYQQAGQDAAAAEYFKLAGEHARLLYANADALEHFRAALALHHPDTAGLHEAIGDLQTLQGNYSAALASYETAAKYLDAKAAAGLEHKRGILHHRRGEWELAEQRFQTALDAFDDNADRERARVYSDWSLTAHHQGHTDQAKRLARCALDLAEEANDTRALAQAHNILGILAGSQGDAPGAEAHLEQSVAFAEKLGDPGIRAAALNNLALIYKTSGEIPRAIELTQTALELCVSQGDRHREAALHNNLADLLHEARQSEAAMAHLKQAVTIFAEIGGVAGAWQPEVWKLVEW